MRRPTPAQMRIAAEWLDEYDEDSDECADMRTVAGWLRVQAAAAELRETSRELGMPVGQVRRVIKARSQAALERPTTES